MTWNVYSSVRPAMLLGVAGLVAGCAGEDAGGGDEAAMAAAPAEVADSMSVARPEERPPVTVQAMPAPPAPPVDRRPAALQVAPYVRGVIEIESRDKRFVPAEYLVVALEGRAGRFETVTDRMGAFVLRSVPAGRYLMVVSPAKGDAVLRQPVTIPPADTAVTVPHIHISADLFGRRP